MKNEHFLGPELWWSILTVVLSFVIWTCIRRFMTQLIKRVGKGKRANSLSMVLSVIKYLMFVITVMIVLEINGMDVSALVTSIGVASAVAVFALQDMLKDLVMGINILMDDFFVVGDIVGYDEVKYGEVLGFNVKTTRLLDLDTGNTVVISNRNITQVKRIADWQIITVPAPYTESAERMRNVCRKICAEAEKNMNVKSCEFLGTGKLADSCIEYRLKVISPLDQKPAAGRAALAAIQDVFAAEGIAIPYPQMDVHMDKLNGI